MVYHFWCEADILMHDLWVQVDFPTLDIQFEADLDFGVDTVADINGDKDEVGTLGPQYRRSYRHISET